MPTALTRLAPRPRAAAGLATTAVAVVALNWPLRFVEAHAGALAGYALSPLARPVEAHGTVVVVAARSDRAAAFDVSVVGTVAPWVALLLLVGAGVILIEPRASLRDCFLRSLAGSVALLVTSVVRIAATVVAIAGLGPTLGYDLADRLVGTVVMLAVLLLAVRLQVEPLVKYTRKRVFSPEDARTWSER
jgi:hypothetical protein